MGIKEELEKMRLYAPKPQDGLNYATAKAQAAETAKKLQSDKNYAKMINSPFNRGLEEKFFDSLSVYIREKGGDCSHEKLPPGKGGIKLYVWEFPEKMFREVIIPQIEHGAQQCGWNVKIDEGPTLIVDGHVKWAEVVIA